MTFFIVTFPNGTTSTVNIVDGDESAAMSKAFLDRTHPQYCRIHEEIAENSNAPVGEMGHYFPPSAYPISAQRMREVYMGGGYCIVPAQ
jgi:hypothetical protein